MPGDVSIEATAIARIGIVRNFLKRAGLRDKVDVANGFARVQGLRFHYRVHLGTGDITRLEDSFPVHLDDPAPEDENTHITHVDDDAAPIQRIIAIIVLLTTG